MEKILGKRKWKSRTDEIIEINKKAEEERNKDSEARKAREAEERLRHITGVATPKKEEQTPKETPESEDEDPGTPPPFSPKES